jgi:hypothetical protein
MQLSLSVQVFETPKEFPNDDGDIFFSKYTGFHLENEKCQTSSTGCKEIQSNQV